MRFEVSCRLRYRIEEPNTFVFNIAVAGNAYQQINQESLYTDPELYVEELRRHEGSRHMRLHAPTGVFVISYKASGVLAPRRENPTDLIEVLPAALPLEVVHYIYPSRYCPSDQLLNFAARQFGAIAPGYARVQAINDWIHANIGYAYGVSAAYTTASDTLISRQGVCRDFAHLGIALCRALNIPARFVAGYAQGLQPPDFHACFEAYLGWRWYLFDPTGLTSRESIVRIGTGRDAAEVSFATIFGRAQMEEMEVFYQGDRVLDESVLALTTC